MRNVRIWKKKETLGFFAAHSWLVIGTRGSRGVSGFERREETTRIVSLRNARNSARESDSPVRVAFDRRAKDRRVSGFPAKKHRGNRDRRRKRFRAIGLVPCDSQTARKTIFHGRPARGSVGSSRGLAVAASAREWGRKGFPANRRAQFHKQRPRGINGFHWNSMLVNRDGTVESRQPRLPR